MKRDSKVVAYLTYNSIARGHSQKMLHDQVYACISPKSLNLDTTHTKQRIGIVVYKVFITSMITC